MLVDFFATIPNLFSSSHAWAVVARTRTSGYGPELPVVLFVLGACAKRYQ